MRSYATGASQNYECEARHMCGHPCVPGDPSQNIDEFSKYILSTTNPVNSRRQMARQLRKQDGTVAVGADELGVVHRTHRAHHVLEPTTEPTSPMNNQKLSEMRLKSLCTC